MLSKLIIVAALLLLPSSVHAQAYTGRFMIVNNSNNGNTYMVDTFTGKAWILLVPDSYWVPIKYSDNKMAVFPPE